VHASDAEQAAMHRALALARTVRGRTSPNPPVGAVILRPDGSLAGEGATSPPGAPHAEVAALADAGDAARGSTVVVTLEPCQHTGRTGPCTKALLAAGVARVVYAVADPNPEASGGAAFLRRHGVDVLGGVAADEAGAGALRPWLHAIRAGRPYVTWKYAATMDGRAAARDWSSRWITGSAARADVHDLRAVVDAILVGSGTVLEDDPQLTVRDVDGALAAHQPLRVVLDRRHRVPQDARVFDTSTETLVLDVAAPRFAMKALFDRGVRHVLLEGGPTVAGAFLEARCVDEVVAYVAPKLLGDGPHALGYAGITSIDQAVTLDVADVTRIGDDVKIVGHPVWPEDH
jgi:diaminohydroxyphosphoribosylaminopyrimidine deaminase / 5-amino-6-(5-phosphoribosylamino)uracil reductase